MDKRRKEYLEMLEIFGQCVQSLEGKRVTAADAWQADIQPLAIKLFFHLGTLFHLQEGTSLPEIMRVTPKYVDFPSVAIVARAAFETYLTFYYIYAETDDKEAKRFRHKLWVLGGFLDRQKFIVTTTEGKHRIEDEKLKIQKIREEILEHPIYANLAKERQKESLKGKWKFQHKWEDLAELAGSHKDYFVPLYAYVSAHAHGSYLSILQVSQATDRQTQRGLTGLYTGVGLNLMSHFIKTYCLLFPEAQKVLDQNDSYKRLVEINHISAADWGKFQANPRVV